MNKGKIVQIIGPVVDVEFSGDAQMPPLLSALQVDYEIEGKKTSVVLEVQPEYRNNPTQVWVRRCHPFVERSTVSQ